MRDINQITLLGRLGQDPDLRFTKNGTGLCSFSLATNKSFKKNGEWETETQWHNITVVGKYAETVSKKLYKGCRAFLQGDIEYQQWEKDGKKFYKTVVKSFDAVLIDSKTTTDPATAGFTDDQQPPVAESAPGTMSEDDLPF